MSTNPSSRARPRALALVRGALALTVVAGLAGACGGKEASTEALAAAPSSSSRVTINGLEFQPLTLSVDAGTTVLWTNEDDVAHTVTSGAQGEQAVPGVNDGKAPRPDGLFDLALTGAGDEVSFAFDEPGTYEYFCDIHRQMTGEIVVQ